MGAIIFLLILFAVVIIFFGPPVYFYFERTFREQKSYERGLKMVSLLIHLPPPSEDVEGAGRDVRDVTEETISKATVIYNIIASTLQKGYKSRFYGQRHLSFEIVGTHGLVYFYASVPVVLIDVVKQAVVSAYPTARVEEAPEHNIFSQAGRIGGTVGGELSLKEPFAYPIATYQDLKRDAMQSLLNALSTLGKEDGVGIQILLRPADPSWRKQASTVASGKRKGDKKKEGIEAIGDLLKEAAVAFVKPPAEKGEKPSKPELSNLDQSVIDAIDDKTRHPGFEVLIRVIVSSNLNQRAQAILNNVVATFSLFDSPGKNGFKYTPAKDIESLVTSYILRFFPIVRNKSILNSVELATIFHFPERSNIPTSQLERQGSRQVDGPRNIPEEGLMLGYNLFRGAKKPIRLSNHDRQRHMYAVGQTGTGKSTFLENLALQDMLNGDGFAFVDPHGDAAERLLAMIPRERTEDVIYFSPADTAYPMGLNLFEFHSPEQKDFLIQEALNMLYKLYDPQHQGIMGPRYEHLFRNAALTVMADPNGGTFVDIPKLFRDPKFVQQKLKYVKDLNVIEFWQKEMPQSQRSNEFGEVVSWFVSKFGAFLSNEMMRNIIGQTKSAFDLRDIMDNKKILLVNLSKGRTGELNSKLLGMIFVMKFQVAAMSRADIPEEERVDFALYVDEFQNFSTDSFATMMSEARKYHLNLIVANQFTTQLTDEVRDAVFGNMGTIVSFRVGQNDVEILSRYFQPTFEPEDLLRLPNYNAITRTLVGGVPTQAFSMMTLPPQGLPNSKLSEALKQLSAAKFGRSKNSVETEIFERLATKPDPVMPPQQPFNTTFRGPEMAGSRPPSYANISANPTPGMANQQNSFQPPPRAPTAPPRTSGSSFLDDWLTKRNSNTMSSAPATVQPRPQQQYYPPNSQTQPPSFNQYASTSPYTNTPPPPRTAYAPPADPYSQPSFQQPPPPPQPSQQFTPPPPVPPAVEPQPEIKPEQSGVNTETPKTEKSEGHLDVHNTGPDEEHTIYIDKQGNLHS